MSQEPTPIADMPSREFVQWAYRTILRRACTPTDCDYFATKLDNTAGSRLALLHGLLVCEEYENLFHPPMAFPAGHFYSPVPSNEDVAAALRRIPVDIEESGIDLHLPEQLELLEQFADLYPSIPFREQSVPGFRYRYANENLQLC